MPLVKTDALPISRDEVEALRGRLGEPHAFEVMDREERRYLFVRAAGDVPHPVDDLERGLEAVPAWAMEGLSDVFLLGGRTDLHVPGHIARPVLQARLKLDERLAAEARASLDVQYGVQLYRVPGDPSNVERLLARVPSERCADLTEADLERLAIRVGSLYEGHQLGHVQSCHLVAERDHFRFRPADFLGDLVERWLEQRERGAKAPDSAGPNPPVAKRVVDITPVFELEQEVSAVPASDADRERLASAQGVVHHLFAEAGFEVQAGDAGLDLVATRTVLHPRRVALAVRPRFDRTEADEALRLVRQHALDVLVVVAPTVEPGAARRVAASRVKPLRPDEVAQLRF